MKYNAGQLKTRALKFRGALIAVLAFGCAFGSATQASAQGVTPPPTPDLIKVNEGNSPFLVGHAIGTQGYICLPTSPGASTAAWNSNNARPEATLFANFFGQKVQIITHFLSPDTNPNGNAPNPLPFGSATWQSSFDSSKVWAQKTGAIPGGSDPASCPNADSIACLRLQSIGSEDGPTGGKLLSQTTFVQRLNTKGGLAPTDGCFTSTDVGKQALVPYTADYYFFRATN